VNSACRWLASLLCVAAPGVRAAEAPVPPEPPGTEGAPPRTVVTLGFDDGRATQLEVLPLLDELGLRASFFVNSGSVGITGYLDYAALGRVQAAGHEMGGHSVDHEVLTEIPFEEVAHQVCDDRAALDAAGLAPLVSFAYPGGSANPEVAAVLASCGYRYGWAQGWIDEGDCTRDCLYAESIPPPDPLRLRSPRSVSKDWSLEDLQGYVTRAETTGGWLGFTFHHICDDCSYTYRISLGLLREFLVWLAARAERGTVVLPLGEAFLPPDAKPPLASIPPARPPPRPGPGPENPGQSPEPPPAPVPGGGGAGSRSGGCSAGGSLPSAAAVLALVALLPRARRRRGR
jgi:peptidoglycan/xylan/chitin deacetylase (PgdA/CDA1 family)